jgi:hypothetical protein
MEEVKKDVVQETQDIFKTYSQARETWAQHAQEDREFKLGKQWSAEQEKKLKSRGQSPIVVNRIHPAVEAAKALITSNRPSFRVSPREDSDNQAAQAMNGLLEYVWQISDGETRLRTVVDDYYVTGMGAMLVYQDPMGDTGKGEVKIRDIDPLDLYIDPNSRERQCDDAENIVVSRLFTKNQAIKMEPMYRDAIKTAQGDQVGDRPETSAFNDGGVIFPEDSETKTTITLGDGDEYIRGYERYQKIIVHRYRTFEKFSKMEEVLDDAKFREYVKKPAWLIQGQVVVDPQRAQAQIQQLMEQYQNQVMAFKQQVTAVAQASQAVVDRYQGSGGMMAGQTPQIPQEPQKPEIKQTNYAQLIEMNQIDVVSVPVWRVRQVVIMGDTLLYERILPTEHYPIVLFMNLHTRTPYPVSDVRLVKHLQQYINKIRSLIIAHATTSTNVKILVPEGSVDMAEFEQKWAQPGVAIQYDPTDGAPMPVQPMPMPNELYKNEQDAKNDIDHELGLYEMMMGNSGAAPQTYKATISLDEFGQRKIRSKLGDIESGLRRLGGIVMSLAQQLYTSEKVFRVLQPNNSMSEYVVNKKLYDDKSGVLKIMNNIKAGDYDLIVVAGSTLPTNKYAQLELYMDAYKNGIIDKQEVLKKTEIFDIEGVLRRTDMIGQLQQKVQQQEEQIKKLSGDLQTREREVYHAKQKAELEKFKSGLDSTSNKAKAAGAVYERRLADSTSAVQKEVGEQETLKRRLETREQALNEQQKKINQSTS